MSLMALNSSQASQQLLAASSALAHSQRTSQSLMLMPEQAAWAQANLDLQTVLDLLRD